MSDIWQCSQGSYHATHVTYEYVVLIAGRITITLVSAGDAFVVDKDFKGKWVFEKHVRKHFDFHLG